MFQFLTRVLGFRSKATSTTRKHPTMARRRFQPKVEALETREVPSATLVDDINVGANSSSPQELVNVNGTLFFSADAGQFGRELWSAVRRNGKFEAEMVQDIRIGGDGSNPLHLTVVAPKGDRTRKFLYFTADDGIHGRELWRTVVRPNGAIADTSLVKDINPGAAGSDPAELTELRTRVKRQPRSFLYFAATNVLNGRELWSTDPSRPIASQRATIMHEINRGTASSDPDYLTVANAPSRFRPFLFLQANDGIHGAELWRATVTRQGIRTGGANQTGAELVEDIRPGAEGSNPFNLTRVGRATTKAGKYKVHFLYFGASDGLTGAELWRSDGLGRNNRPGVGTFLVRDINPGPGDSLLESATTLMAAFRNQLFFAADDGFRGRELWRTFTGKKLTNGVVAELLMDINRGPDSSNPTAQEHPLPKRRNLILKNANGVDVWLFFGADDGFTGGEPWRTNAKAASRLMDINVGPASSLVQNELIGIVFPENKVKNRRQEIFFAADDGFFGRELWRSGGRVGRRDTDINPGAPPSNPSEFEIVEIGGRRFVFFAADKALLGRELWQVV